MSFKIGENPYAYLWQQNGTTPVNFQRQEMPAVKNEDNNVPSNGLTPVEQKPFLGYTVGTPGVEAPRPASMPTFAAPKFTTVDVDGTVVGTSNSKGGYGLAEVGISPLQGQAGLKEAAGFEPKLKDLWG